MLLTSVLCFGTVKCHMIVQIAHDQITSASKSKCTWPDCILCIPFILSGSPNKHVIQKCFSCIKATWRLGLWGLLETHNYAGKFAFNFNERRGFSSGTLVFPSPQKPTFPNCNSTRNQVDEEPLSGCATCKSLFMLFIYLFNYVCPRRRPWKNKTGLSKVIKERS